MNEVKISYGMAKGSFETNIIMGWPKELAAVLWQSVKSGDLYIYAKYGKRKLLFQRPFVEFQTKVTRLKSTITIKVSLTFDLVKMSPS